MNQRELKRAIDSSKLDNLYIFCSEDYYLKKVYIERIKKATQLDLERVDIDSEELLPQLEVRMNSRELFGRRKLIHARLFFHLDGFKLKNRSDNLIIIDPIACKSFQHPSVVRFEKPTEREIEGFVSYFVKREKKSISKEATRLIVEQFKEKTATELNQYMEKLMLFCASCDHIGSKEAQTLLEESVTHSAFEIAGYLLHRNKRGFLKKLKSVTASTEPPVLIGAIASRVMRLIPDYLNREKDLSGALEKSEIKSLIKLLKALYELDEIVKSLSSGAFYELFKARMLIWLNMEN